MNFCTTPKKSNIDAIYTIDIIDSNDGTDALNAQSSISLSIARAGSNIQSLKPSSKCMTNEAHIDMLQDKIRKLKHKLVKTQKRVSYLERMKFRLNTAISDLKDQNIIAEEDCKFLEVIDKLFLNC